MKNMLRMLDTETKRYVFVEMFIALKNNNFDELEDIAKRAKKLASWEELITRFH